MSTAGDFGNPLRKFKLVFLGEQSGKYKKMQNMVLVLRALPENILTCWLLTS